jgi:hypothetical protein
MLVEASRRAPRGAERPTVEIVRPRGPYPCPGTAFEASPIEAHLDAPIVLDPDAE